MQRYGYLLTACATAVIVALILAPGASALVGMRSTPDVINVAINGSAGAEVAYTFPDQMWSCCFKSGAGLGFNMGTTAGEIAAGTLYPFAGNETQCVGETWGGKTVYFRGATAAADEVDLLCSLAD